jgi:hypothetical protein
MNRLAAIKCQLDAIAEHITGPEGYSLTSLCEVRAHLLDTFDRVDAEIIKREKAPVRNIGLFANLGKPDGGAA